MGKTLRRRYALFLSPRARLGIRGEDAAFRYLAKRGYYVWIRNWRCRYGELDLIAYRNKTLVIVEVKARSAHKDSAFSPLDHIDERKMKQLERLSARFVRYHQVELKARRLSSWQIDAISITVGRWGQVAELEHVENIGGQLR